MQAKLSCKELSPLKSYRFECIPVGCVPPALYGEGASVRGGGVLSRGVSVQGTGGLCPAGVFVRETLSPYEQND